MNTAEKWDFQEPEEWDGIERRKEPPRSKSRLSREQWEEIVRLAKKANREGRMFIIAV